MIKKYLQNNLLTFFLVVILISFFTLTIGLAWTGPDSNPPNGNIAAPLNVSNVGQVKLGGLTLNWNGNETSIGLIVKAGKVGIGTTSPEQKLDVVGGYIRSNTGFCIGTNCITAWPTATGGGITGSGSSGQVTFWTGSSIVGGNNDLFWDNTNKRLGIGTTNPSYKLDVSGDIRVSGVYRKGSNAGTDVSCGTGQTPSGITISGGIVTSAGSCTSIGGGGGGGVSGSGTNNYLAKWTGSTSIGSSIIYDNGTNVGIGTTEPQNKLDVRGFIQSAGPLTGTYSASGLELRATDSGNFWQIVYRGSSSGEQGNITYWYWNGTKWINSLSLTPSGNVGIGTTSPTPLVGSSQKTLHISDTTNGAGIRLTGAEGISGGMAIGGSKSVGMAVGTVTNHALQFYTNSSERMRIDTSGNVGIGTTTPVNSNLHVYAPTGYATIRIESGGKGTGTSPLLAFKNKDDPVGWTIGQDSWYSNAFSIQRDANPWPRYFLITQAGSVGIGTTNPAGPLHVHSNSSQGAIYISGVSDNGHTYSAIYLNNETADTNNDWVISHRKEVGSDMEGDLHIGRWTNSTYRLDIDIDKNTGNVGIGKTDPAYKLDVAGDIRTTGCLVYNGGSLGICVSDIRLKDNITDLSFNNALAKVLSLQPKQFTLKNDPLQKISGLIAQEVEQFAPELVVTDEKGYKQIKYGDVQWLLIEAIKEQQKEIEELKAKF